MKNLFTQEDLQNILSAEKVTYCASYGYGKNEHGWFKYDTSIEGENFDNLQDAVRQYESYKAFKSHDDNTCCITLEICLWEDGANAVSYLLIEEVI